MAESDSLKQLGRYARVARNSQMLLTMEPPQSPAIEVAKARATIAKDAFDFLTEVQEGVESPYFTPYTYQDAKYIEMVAAEKARQSVWDRLGVFNIVGPEIKTTNSAEAQSAMFAYMASSWMRTVKTPFYNAPSLRASVAVPRNLAEFVNTVGQVKEVTLAAVGEQYHAAIQKPGWRLAFAFWEASRWLAGTLTLNRAEPANTPLSQILGN